MSSHFYRLKSSVAYGKKIDAKLAVVRVEVTYCAAVVRHVPLIAKAEGAVVTGAVGKV
jgi:hypothetical protein